jgi:hypothetical protein
LGEERKEKKREREREKWPGVFFLGKETGHAFLAVPSRIFVAVRCNYRLVIWLGTIIIT